MKRLTLTILLVLTATTASAGTLWTEWFDCNPIYKLYSLSWKEPWLSGATRRLESAPTNQGPWETVQSDLPEAGCRTPVDNLHWYRVKSCSQPLPLSCFVDSNQIWVPQQLCIGNPRTPDMEVRS
jgi:hypothetical protein